MYLFASVDFIIFNFLLRFYYSAFYLNMYILAPGSDADIPGVCIPISMVHKVSAALKFDSSFGVFSCCCTHNVLGER